MSLKNNAPSIADRVVLLFLFFWRPITARKGFTVACLVAAAAFAGGWALWNHVRATVAARDVYRLVAGEIHITPPPSWIHADVRAEVVRDAGLAAGLSILDDGLVERVHQAFALHPWVAKVERVSKRHPAHVEVELIYRRPAAMVKVAEGLYPVDGEGVLLPSEDFSPLEARGYPRLTGVESTPQGLTGTRWGDPIVSSGAKIGEALAPLWFDLQLQAIHWVKPGAGADTATAANYELVTAGGNHIAWARARKRIGWRADGARKGRAFEKLHHSARRSRRSQRAAPINSICDAWPPARARLAARPCKRARRNSSWMLPRGRILFAPSCRQANAIRCSTELALPRSARSSVGSWACCANRRRPDCSASHRGA